MPSPHFNERLKWFLEKRPDLASLVSRWGEPGSNSRRLLSLARAFRMKSILARMLDENEFLSPYGIRALSRYHLDHPYMVDLHGTHYEVDYDPAESTLPDLRWQLELARPDLDAGELPDRREPAPLLRLLRRRLQGGMSYRVGQVSHIVGGGGRDRLPPDEAVSAGRKRASGFPGRRLQAANRPELSAIICSSTSTSTAIPAAAWERITRPAGRA